MKPKKPVVLFSPSLVEPITFESIRACARFLDLDHSFVRYALYWGGSLKGMRVVEAKEVTNGE